MKPPFKFSWELVTPAIAAEMLKHNPEKQNRNLREKAVFGFAADMANGNWSPSHQGIAFAVGGRLIDGQHRLAAVVRSGVSVPFLICRDVPERIDGVKSNVMDTLDRGNARSIPDVLKLSHGQYANPNIVAGICGMIPKTVFHHISGENYLRRVAKPTLHQTLAVLDLYKKGIKMIVESTPKAVVLRGVSIGAAVAIAHAVRPAETEEFYQRFVSGAGLATNSPILSIRNYCLNAPIGRAGSIADRIAIVMKVLAAIHAFINGGTKAGAKEFLDQQAKNIAAIERIFPSLDPTAPVTTAATWKPNAKVDQLLRGKEMSDRIHRKVARQG